LWIVTGLYAEEGGSSLDILLFSLDSESSLKEIQGKIFPEKEVVENKYLFSNNRIGQFNSQDRVILFRNRTKVVAVLVQESKEHTFAIMDALFFSVRDEDKLYIGPLRGVDIYGKKYDKRRDVLGVFNQPSGTVLPFEKVFSPTFVVYLTKEGKLGTRRPLADEVLFLEE
jgi:hypothetical protein